MVTSGHVTKMVVTLTSIDTPLPKTPCYTQTYGCMFYRTGVIATRSFTLQKRNFLPFCSCDLDRDPMTFIYEGDPYFFEI